MCGYCKAMTAGEAEHFYGELAKGTMTAVPPTVLGEGSPRADLQQRQQDELEGGAFADAPAFREDLLLLCRSFGSPAWSDHVGANYDIEEDDTWLMLFDFEWALVKVRERNGRPVMTDDEVDEALHRCGIELDDHQLARRRQPLGIDALP